MDTLGSPSKTGDDKTSAASALGALEPLNDARPVYAQLCEDLVFGVHGSGARLRPAALRARYACAPGALREHLLRLWGEGLVAMEEQRGFFTLAPNPQSFYEARHQRLLLEAEGARLSIRNGDLEWEANLQAAHHKLAHIERRMQQGAAMDDPYRLWSRYDWAFHQALMAACGSALLLREHARSYKIFRLHTASELKAFGFRSRTSVREHGAIVRAAVGRDGDACAAALSEHLDIYRNRKHLHPDPFAEENAGR